MRSAKPQIMTRLSDGEPWKPAKVSEMMLEFAAPLLDLVDPPRTGERIRSAMHLASLCWNARLYEELGDETFIRALEPVIEQAPNEVRTALEKMLEDRRTRFADIGYAVLADVTGESAEEVRVTAGAYVPEVKVANLLPRPPAAPQRSGARGPKAARVPSGPGGMMPFDLLFQSVAEEETRSIHVPPGSKMSVPEGTYLFREFYCTEPRCDCRRVILHVVDVARERVAASINYAFEPPRPPFDDEQQVALDPLNPQSEASDGLLQLFEQMVEFDAAYRARLVRHYTMWKQVVDDPSHPDHGKVRSVLHEDPTFESAFPYRQPVRRASAKVGANDPCACGSGKKYKRCCRAMHAAR